MTKFYERIGKSMFMVIVVGIVMIFARVISVFFTWLSALIIEWLFGAWITRTVNHFSPLHFQASWIPGVAVILSLIGSFFVGSRIDTDSKKGKQKGE